ncbi:MAG: hypothetical protein KME40_04400 [Komarekiella atlantica HA4396-MV6]|jgi:hypothetical protein|nr:hypothetical protein [Komarekiella atlantica HA4396-MV6]
MRLQIRLFKLITFILIIIVIVGLNIILLRSSLDLHLYLINISGANYDFYLFQVVRHILKVLGAAIVEAAFVWLLVVLNTMSLRLGLIITLILLILSGIIILLPISI